MKNLIKLKFSKIITFYYLVITLLAVIMPLSVQSEPLETKIWANIETKKSFHKNDLSGIQIKKSTPNVSSQLTLNHLDENQIVLDHSFLNFTYKNTTLGFGKISRNWSFSPNESLILSHNARPPTSVNITIESNSKPENIFFSWLGPWSFEGFNSFLTNTTGPENPMLLGVRTVIEPLKNLKFELVKTAQWGGDGYNANISQLRSALIGNTNENEFAHVNQLAGFGFSYLINIREMPFRLYTQFIGEDEAGNLPSCYMNLIGTELNLYETKFLSKIGFEYIDTRIGLTTHGNCGPNTAYNNNTYQYTSYDSSLGAQIDSEGKSLNFWGNTILDNNITLNYSIKNILINDYNWYDHRLANARQNGWVTTIGASWNIGALELQSNLTYQDFELNKSNITKGISLNLNTEYSF